MILTFRGKETTLQEGDLIALIGKKGQQQHLCIIRKKSIVLIDGEEALFVGKFLDQLKNFQRLCKFVAASHNLDAVATGEDARPSLALYCFKIQKRQAEHTS